MKEDMFELKRNLIQRHFNSADLLDERDVDEIPPSADAVPIAKSVIVETPLPVVEPVVESVIAKTPLPAVELVVSSMIAKTPLLVVEPVAESVIIETPLPVAEPVVESVIIETPLPVVEPVVESVIAKTPLPVIEPVAKSVIAKTPPVVDIVVEESVRPISNAAAALFEESRRIELPTESTPTPSSEELMRSGLALLWSGGKSFVSRLFQARRPALEMLLVIPVAIFVGYQFRSVSVEPVPVEVSQQVPTRIQIEMAEPKLAVVQEEPKYNDSLLVVVTPPENPVKPFQAPRQEERRVEIPPAENIELEVAAVETKSSVTAPFEEIMATPVLLEREGYKAPVPRKKVVVERQERPGMVTPPPRHRVKAPADNNIKTVKIAAVDYRQPKKNGHGFVLFLGSYRKSRTSYLDSITNNLKREPIDLIKQTVQINSESYTRLYAGPFASREQALLARKALFASQKINSSVSYLQPGASRFSLIEQVARTEQVDKKALFTKRTVYRKKVSPPKLKEYVVRVGSYQNKGVNSSGNLLRKINGLGKVGFQKGIEVNGKVFWRVYSGPYNSLQQAAQARQALHDNFSLPNMILMEKNPGSKWVRLDV